jgi:hypothetical protein
MGCPNVRQIGNPGRLSSFADCQAACDARDDCDAIQINTRTRHPQNNCLLYSNECNKNRVDGVCTSIKDCFYFERVCEDVQVWTIFDRDCAGNDIRSLNVNSLEECKAACISEPLCKGIGRSEKSNSCWLKTVSTCDSVKSRTPVNVCGSGNCFYSLQAAQSFDFELRGHVGDELVIITDGEDTHTATLSTDYKAFSAINENIVITFKNDIGPRDVYFKSSVHTNIRSDGLFFTMELWDIK